MRATSVFTGMPTPSYSVVSVIFHMFSYSLLLFQNSHDPTLPRGIFVKAGPQKSPRNDKEPSPMTPQQYGGLNKT